MLDRLKMAPEEGGEDEDDVATPSCELEDDRVWTLPSDMDGVSDGLCALVVGGCRTVALEQWRRHGQLT